MYVIISNIVGFMLAFMEVCLCYIIICNTIIEIKNLNKKDIIIFITASSVIGILLSINRKIVFVSYSMILLCIILTVLSIWFVKKNELLLIIGIVSTYYLIVAFFELFFAFMSMIFLKQKFDQTVYFFANSVWKNAIYLLSGIIILIIFYVLKKRQKNYYVDCSFLKNKMILLDIVLYIVFRQYQEIMDDMALGEQEMLGAATGLSLLAIIAVVGLVSIIYLKYRITQEENRNYLVRDEIYKKNYDDMEEVIKINSQRLHDVKNHFAVIKELCVQNKLSEVEKYVDNIYNEYYLQSYQSWTSNSIIDIILNQKKAIAERKQIEFNIDVMIIPSIKLNDIEICSLFGNLLDNAIEACEKQVTKHKFIDFKIYAQNGLLFIMIKNSIESKPKIEKGELITSKEDKTLHGYGLKSVNRIVKKYDGLSSYTIEKDTFEINVSFYDIINTLN